MKEFTIRNTGDRKAEVLIYEPIGESLWEGGVSAKGFAEQIKALGEVDEINVRINSPGGLISDGMAIYNTLSRHPAKIVVDIDGLAASAASWIAMAGDEIRMAEMGLMMIHNTSDIVWGDKNAMAKAAETLDKMDRQWAEAYARRSGRRPETFLKLMDAETWFTAAEALENRLVDEVVPGSRPENVFDLSKFKNAPKNYWRDAQEPVKPLELTPRAKVAKDEMERVFSARLKQEETRIDQLGEAAEKDWGAKIA